MESQAPQDTLLYQQAQVHRDLQEVFEDIYCYLFKTLTANVEKTNFNAKNTIRTTKCVSRRSGDVMEWLTARIQATRSFAVSIIVFTFAKCLAL